MNRRWISPPVAFAIAAIAMWLIGRNVEFGSYSFAHQTAIGIALVVLGVLIVGWSLRLFRAVEIFSDRYEAYRRRVRRWIRGPFAVTSPA
jgi:hypothetical protein